MRRYILHPGYVRSRTDGQEHFIGAAKLADLYNVCLRDCIDASSPEYLSLRRSARKDAVHLYPRATGNYEVPPV